MIPMTVRLRLDIADSVRNAIDPTQANATRALRRQDHLWSIRCTGEAVYGHPNMKNSDPAARVVLRASA